MWVFLSKSFLSVVVPNPADLPKGLKKKDVLSVRARKRGDILEAFPGVRVMASPGRDYAFRAYVPRQRVATVMFNQVMGVNYSNFKNTVHEPERHDAYLDVWSAMNSFQYGGYARKRQPIRSLPAWRGTLDEDEVVDDSLIGGRYFGAR